MHLFLFFDYIQNRFQQINNKHFNTKTYIVMTTTEALTIIGNMAPEKSIEIEVLIGTFSVAKLNI